MGYVLVVILSYLFFDVGYILSLTSRRYISFYISHTDFLFLVPPNNLSNALFSSTIFI